MKSLNLISTGSLCLAMFACSTAANAPVGTGTGGQIGSGGTDSSAGTSSATGGSGNSATGGSTTTMAGSSSSAGTGGATATGGSPAGGNPATGGTGGSGTSGGSPAGGSAGGGSVDTSLVGAWDGALLQYPCGPSGKTNYDCPQPPGCQGATAQSPMAAAIPPANGAASSWTMGGTPGTTYSVTMHVQGVVEVSWYHGGTRAAGNDTSITVTPRNTFQTGGTALTFADTGNGFDYNQYELDVTPAGGGTPAVYFLNSVKPAENPHTNNVTTHLTFDIDYTATIPVPAGAKVSVTVRDSNCIEVQNCGTSAQASCMGPRSISLSGSTPPPPGSWNGKVTSSGSGGAVLNGQFIHFDITSVTVAK